MSEQSRRVLTEQEWQTTFRTADRAAPRVGYVAMADALAAALATVGILTPPPEPDDNTCTAMYADLNGGWWQCTEEPGHDDTGGHDSGEWAWSNDAPDAIPPRPAEHAEHADG